MLATTAINLKEGDEFTSNDGADWHTVSMKHVVDVGHYQAVILTTEEYEKIWLWSNEEIVVRI
jgi:hypothetical protein